ncbi:hypothetical protein [Arthrobacter sp. VKM Ac-2550]|uniref:hypothetical protein n=1 Tax=Crystallibacter permensis TaxID=1938888 RepID=UPI0022266425|nr:hypothetical protein [Arthrobacter sp. VKM Ac-2550]MCW2131930.1 hypothetical protein [Arthrobacter sp. VKM Ac-2550]
MSQLSRPEQRARAVGGPVAGGSLARRGATLLVGAGLAASGPTAVAGAGDWAELTGTERRIGAVHALGTDVAVFLLLGSLIARLRGRHALATGLGLAGNTIVAGAGFLDGHLALNRGTARRCETGGLLDPGRGCERKDAMRRVRRSRYG